MLVPKERFSHVHVDVVGPFPLGQRLIVIFLRWSKGRRAGPRPVPLADTAADTIVRTFVETWISRYGVPITVTSDRGAQFTSEAWRVNSSNLGINISTTSAYHPQSNGIVERFHRSLKNALRCAVRSNPSWTRTLPWVIMGLRNSPRLDTATSTAEVVFGVPQRIPGLCFQSEQYRPRSAEEQLKQSRANVASYTPRALGLTKFKSSPFVEKSLRTAQYVFVRDDRLGKPSLSPRYSGPFQVKKKDWDSNTFVLVLGNREDSVTISRLKAASIPQEQAWRRRWWEGCCIHIACIHKKLSCTRSS